MRAFAIVTASVLVVVGIGIGIVGGLAYAAPSAHTFGAAPFRFSVAFPNYLGGSVTYRDLPVSRSDTTPALGDYSLYADDYEASVQWLGEDSAVGTEILHYELGGFLTGYRTRTFSAGGVTTTLAASACGLGKVALPVGACSDVEIVRAGDTTWLVQAGSTPDTRPLAQDFVRSFHLMSEGSETADPG